MSTQNVRQPGEHRIVVGVDGSDGADRALCWAAAQAAHSGAVLEVHSASGPGYVLGVPDDVERSVQHVIDRATERAVRVAPGITVRGVAHGGWPADVLIKASDGADLLVVGSRGLGGFHGLLLGSVSQQCALHAQCPTVIIR